MENKKELTKDLLTLSFRELILKIPFDKITIKMITDGAGVIRPTFYKHFQDKYGILEYILQKEIREKIDVLIENHLENDIFLLLCSCLSKDRAFYKKLYLIEGPNSFEEQMFQFIYELIFFLFNKYPLKAPSRLKILTKESLARFYTFGLADSIKYAITHDVAYKSKNKISARYYWESVCCCFFFLRFSRRFSTRFLPRLIAFMIRAAAKTAAMASARISQIGTLLSCTL